MTEKEKKAKAAAIAVGCYLQIADKCENNINCDRWRRINKYMIMQRRGLLQLKGNLPSNFRLRM